VSNLDGLLGGVALWRDSEEAGHARKAKLAKAVRGAAPEVARDAGSNEGTAKVPPDPNGKGRRPNANSAPSTAI
jgi:hypothetical protein